MHPQQIIDAMNEQHATACEPGQWSLGMLVDALRALDAGHLTVNLSSRVMSYRGYYNHLSIAPGESTVRELLAALEEAIGGKVFEGYKGGDYTYSRKTPVWVSDYGDASEEYVVGLVLSGSGLGVTLKKAE